ncbi:GntR family transcriptional regulator [Acuticoccus sp. M5D2P5]|uniref:GntR family transcriptional regulator n=1 Tax=Acuticoccus kalidii TaxID=2910977 RepID=UPI001F1D036F|nr:GntR family transcriptional regulator [Acuticoccus kalidii]
MQEATLVNQETTGSVHATRVYVSIAETLREAIAAGRLVEGTVLLERPLAEIFGASRSPVRQALRVLAEEGLVHPFAGRGLLVGRDNAPVRVPVTREILQLRAQGPVVTKVPTWRSLWYDFEREVILRSVYGSGTINELALARRFDVGRTVAHDLLLHAQQVGIVFRDRRARWSIVQFDDNRLDNLYSLRLILEPVALRLAADRVPRARLTPMIENCRVLLEEPVGDARSALDRLEYDLHIECLEHSANAELPRALRVSNSMLIAGKHIQAEVGQVGTAPPPMIAEHCAVLEALASGRVEHAVEQLAAHLESSRRRSEMRVAAFLARNPSYEIAYVST